MKKILGLFIFVFSTITLTGCNMFRDYDTQKKLHEIVPTTSFAKDGQLVINAKNDTGVAVKMTYIIEFYNSENNLIETKKEVLEVVRADDEVLIGIKPPSGFLTYKVTLDVAKTEKSYDILFKTEDIDNKKNVVLKFSNNNDFIINHLDISIGYYYENELIGLTNNVIKNIEPNKTTEITMNYPTDSNGKKIKFDSYKIFINDLYHEAK